MNPDVFNTIGPAGGRLVLRPGVILTGGGERRGIELVVEVGPCSANGPVWSAPTLRTVAVRDHGMTPASDADARIDLPDATLTPAFVNAHTHLDLTSVGPQPFRREGGFDAWLDMVRNARPTTPEGLREAVAMGVARSRLGGVAAIGDIAGAVAGSACAHAARALAESPAQGVSFVEFFASKASADANVSAAVEAMRAATTDRSAHRVSIQPHAPYSVAPEGFQGTTRHIGTDIVLSTHLAESMAERRYIRDADGPMRDLMERMGIWTTAEDAGIGQGMHPIEYFAAHSGSSDGARWIVAHVNDCPDDMIDVLRGTGASVAYCPRSSSYFGHHADFGPHRYRDLLDAGINVCLGTDSIINLPREGRTMSVLDEARFLHRRDGTAPGVLLGMATTRGARGLGMRPSGFDFEPNASLAGFCVFQGVSGGDALMKSDQEPTWSLLSTGEGDADVA